MTEQHECGWEPFHGYLVWCPTCKKTPRADDVIQALNEYETLKRATEALTAEDAKSSGDILSDFSKRLAECQQAYVDILSSKGEVK